MTPKVTISLIVGCLISALTLYLAFRNVPTGELINYVQAINYWWILPTVVIVVLTFVLRTIRWMIILKDICNLSFWQAFHPTMIAFMMNCVLPGRVGELARPALLKQNRAIPMSTGFATVAADRIFDLIFLICLFALVSSSLTVRSDLEGTYFGMHLDSQTLQSVAAGMIRLSVALLCGMGLMSFSRTRNIIKKMITASGRQMGRSVPRLAPLMRRLTKISIDILENFAIGISLVGKPIQLLSCLGITFMIWALTAASYVIYAMGCPGVNLSIMEFTTVMVIVCFVIALPSVPGFWGLWEAGGVFALALFGIAEKDALGFILVNHAAQVFPVIGIGLVSALITSVNIMQLGPAAATSTPQPSHHGEKT